MRSRPPPGRSAGAPARVLKRREFRTRRRRVRDSGNEVLGPRAGAAQGVGVRQAGVVDEGSEVEHRPVAAVGIAGGDGLSVDVVTDYERLGPSVGRRVIQVVEYAAAQDGGVNGDLAVI